MLWLVGVLETDVDATNERGMIMTAFLTEEQVMDIHTNHRLNGGKLSMHKLCVKHGITTNECYAVLRTPLEDALRRARKHFRFVSWDPHKQAVKATRGELDATKFNTLYRSVPPH